jgi:NADPH:quinone reductase-like Zn-dependent oxidoreductase
MSQTHYLSNDKRRELTCTAWAERPQLSVRTCDVPRPGPGQGLVRVEATSVNPIDVKRAAGYGRRLLGLKGAATLPIVLGNDLAGVVEAVGAGVSGFAPQQRVFGLVGTARSGGAHASHVVVPQEQLLAVSESLPLSWLAVLPYSFTTMWLAVASMGLGPSSAAGKRVLINGANGGLGSLALQLLRGWGSPATGICAAGTRADCLALGAETPVERGPGCIASLPDDFDAVLNFGGWDDDVALASRLGSRASGHATTVHPLLDHFDRFGFRACESPRLEACARDRRVARAARPAGIGLPPDRHRRAS